MLFNYRADPNKVDKQGYSGLHWAVFNTKPEAAYTLLSEGADMFIKVTRYNKKSVTGEIGQRWNDTIRISKK